MPWTIRRTVPSGTRWSWWIAPTVPTRCRSSGPGSLLALALRHEGQKPIAAHDVVDELDGARPPHGERHRRQREHDGVPERQDRERVGNDEVRGTGAGLRRHQRASARLGSVMRSRP